MPNMMPSHPFTTMKPREFAPSEPCISRLYCRRMELMNRLLDLRLKIRGLIITRDWRINDHRTLNYRQRIKPLKVLLDDVQALIKSLEDRDYLLGICGGDADTLKDVMSNMINNLEEQYQATRRI